MIDPKTQERLANDFLAARGRYHDLSVVLESLFATLIRGAGCTFHSVTSRCKTHESLVRKLTLPSKSYSQLIEITDLAGLRITTYFSDDVDVVAEIVEREFLVDSAHSVDKRQQLDPDRFGYQSLHYVVQMTPSRCALSEYRRFEGLRFEVQISSILQHAWAEIEHDLGYKSAAGVPREIRRRFARVAGLLELADDEFSAIRTDLAAYVESVRGGVATSSEPQELNLPSLRQMYSQTTALSNLDNIVAEVAGSRIGGTAEDVDDVLLPWLHRLSIDSVQRLEATAQRESDELRNFSRYWLEGEQYDELHTGIGLFYLVFLLLWRTHDRSLISDYCFQSNFGDPSETAKHLLAYSSANAA